MILSNQGVLKAMEEGFVVIEPFIPKNVKNSSVDVTLGEHFFRERKDNHRILNPYDPEHVRVLYGELQSARTAQEESGGKMDDGNWKNIKPHQRVIIINPGENLLCHTVEFIGGKDHITTQMHARSTIGRILLLVCKCAGWGDIGYINRWTMELTNTSDKATKLIVGTPIAQLSFHETTPLVGADYGQTGNYQKSSELEEIKKLWNPEMMLPKALKNHEE